MKLLRKTYYNLNKTVQTWGSMSLTVLLAFSVNVCISPAYCTVAELSSVVRIGIPKLTDHNMLKTRGG